MRSRLLPVAGLLMIQTFCWCDQSYAQLPKRLQRCLPYPTFADELRAMNPSPTLRARSTPPAVMVDSVELEGVTTLPDSFREQVIREAKGQDLDRVREEAEVFVRGSLQDQGYFKADATVEPRPAPGDASHQHVDVTIHVDEGPQYFLDHVEFRSADPDQSLAYSSEQLRQLVPLEDGDIFNADKVRTSLDNLKHLYDSQGYIDFTAEPEFSVDDAQRRISLTLVLDQQKQYRIGNVEAVGLDRNTDQALKSKIRSGDIFDPAVTDQFISENKASLPYDASREDVTVRRNVKTGIVDLSLDFFTCPTTSH